jgi:hypothetical protein
VYKNNVLMLNLTAFSLLFVLIEVGIFLYSGSMLPGTGGAGPTESFLMWSVSCLLIGLPVLTAVLWIFRLVRSGRRLK